MGTSDERSATRSCRVECSGCGEEFTASLPLDDASIGFSTRRHYPCPYCEMLGPVLVLPPRVAVGYRAKGYTKGRG